MISSPGLRTSSHSALILSGARGPGTLRGLNQLPRLLLKTTGPKAEPTAFNSRSRRQPFGDQAACTYSVSLAISRAVTVPRLSMPRSPARGVWRGREGSMRTRSRLYISNLTWISSRVHP